MQHTMRKRSSVVHELPICYAKEKFSPSFSLCLVGTLCLKPIVFQWDHHQIFYLLSTDLGII